MRKNKFILILLLITAILSTTGFTMISKTPKTVYRVYLKGKSLGLIKSKLALEKYIDQEQNAIKKKYGVDKVYVPEDLDIVKEKTYSSDIKTTKEIYNEIRDISPFTISGYSIKIKGLNTKNSEGKTIKGSNNIVYTLKKNTFTKAVEKTVKSFIPEDSYNKYATKTQTKIEDTGTIIEDIYIKNKITIKKQNIPVNEKIYQSEEELAKYLLFGTTEDQKKYTVKDGDNIAAVAFDNKISTEELLIANPNLKNENTLLAPGQEVVLGILKPQFSLVEVDHTVFKEEKNYTTETRYDNNKYVGYSEVIQAGVKGENKVTQKIEKINGEITNVVTVGTPEVIKEPINEIVVKGGKKSSYYGGGYGTAVPTRGQWGWPATCSSISSPFGYRWGTLHDAVDIAGCGYGSNIFAAQAGTVVQSGYKYDNGEYVTIDHHNGYYTLYAHMVSGSRRVRVGDYVEKGQVLGGMGRTGAATGVHLHFAFWNGFPYRGGRPLNPMIFY